MRVVTDLRRWKPHTILLPALLATLAATAGRVSIAADGSLQPCHLDGFSEQVLCGHHDVYENRHAASGRRIPLRFAVIPALSAKAEPDPLFLLAGGPGQAATGLAVLAGGPFKRIRAHRDIVLVDQRGTGESRPLECPGGDDDLSRLTRTAMLEDPSACLRGLDADVRFYSNFEAMEDLDEIRAALGYDRVNLWGGSYGTRAALVYLRLHPEHVRSVVLDGAAPFTVKFPLYTARNAQRSLDLLFDACEADRDCHAAFPNFRTETRDLLASLERSPARALVRHPRTGQRREMEITRAGFASLLRGFLYVPAHRSLVPAMMHEAAQGNFEPLLALGLSLAGWSFETMSLGMTCSILCSEDVPRIAREAIDSATRATFIGRAEVDSWSDLCAAWPRADLPADYDRPVRAQTPALILSGGLDPATPPAWGEEVARELPNSRHVVAPNAAHGVSFSGCLPDLIADFVEAGAAEGLDTACVNAISTPPFVTGSAGPKP